MDNVEAPSEKAPGLSPKLVAATDLLSKGVAGFAIALYSCGFLIVSIHYSRYGFVGTNPFRPRIAAAGAWFFFLTAIPVFVVTRAKGLQKSWIELAEFSYLYYV